MAATPDGGGSTAAAGQPKVASGLAAALRGSSGGSNPSTPGEGGGGERSGLAAALRGSATVDGGSTTATPVAAARHAVVSSGGSSASLTGTPGAAATAATPGSAPKGILKTNATIAAKRESDRRAHLDLLSKEIWFKVLVLGHDGAGKSSIIQSLATDRAHTAPEPTVGIETTTLLAATYQVRPMAAVWGSATV